MSRFHNRNFELLEPYDAKVSCTVLRGESIRKDADLLDRTDFPALIPQNGAMAELLLSRLPSEVEIQDAVLVG